MNIIIQFLSHFGYPAVFLFMTLTATMIPIPSEIVMPFAGFMAQQGHVNIIVVIVLGTLGDVVGSLVAYAIGYYLENHIVLGLIDRYGKYIFFRKHEYDRALHWLDKYGARIVFFGKCLPGIRSFISLPAGLAKMNIFKFTTYAFLGSFIWLTFLTIVGFYLGKNWGNIHTIFSKLEYVIGAMIIVAIAYYIYNNLKRKKHTS